MSGSAGAADSHEIVHRRTPADLRRLAAFGAVLYLSACLYFALQAFGAETSYAAVALVYLTAGTVLAALTGIGIASSTALAGVFRYRLATCWLPTLPGFVAFRWLTARDAI